jgi:hypothetical protein
MTQQKQTALTNWLLGLLTTIATGSFLFAWNTNAKLTTLVDHDMQKADQISRLTLKQDNMQISEYDLQTRVTHLEDKIKTH